MAYQGGARGLGIEAVLNINLFATESSYPQLTLLFDIPPELGLKRIAANANREINRLDLEQLSFHQKVRDTYLQLAKRFKDRYVIIDASLPLQTVIDNTYQAIHQRLL